MNIDLYCFSTAVKANDSAPVLGILAQVGAGFDCASKVGRIFLHSN